MKSRFLSVAETEFTDGAAYYQAEAGLGEEFIGIVLGTVSRLERHPMLGRLVGKRVRSFPVRKFPFSIIYEIVDDEIVIVAVAHQNRKPEYWHDRITT